MAPKRLDAKLLRDALGGSSDEVGVFQALLGFRTGTGALKAVHLMNDLAQTVSNQIPAHDGDLLCRVTREHHERSEAEGNSDSALRADPELGGIYGRAYPERLGAQLISDLRSAAGRVLNVDTGMYEPGKRMASPLATHVGLLGADGFGRFLVGPFLASLLGVDGRARLQELFCSDTDPVTRALRPLFAGVELRERQQPEYRNAPSHFDSILGARLSTLLTQPLSKPTLLRSFALAASLGILLKIFGVGRAHGRPALLALSSSATRPRTLRRVAVQSLQRGRDALDRALANELNRHPSAEKLWSAKVRTQSPTVEIRRERRDETAALQAIRAMRNHRAMKSKGEIELYWPDKFALALAGKAGLVSSRTAGWGQHLRLSPEHIEILAMMFVPPTARAPAWKTMWRQIRDDIGVVVGANPSEDARFLEDAGVMHAGYEELAKNALSMLNASVSRGVARLLPDSGAEVTGGQA